MLHGGQEPCRPYRAMPRFLVGILRTETSIKGHSISRAIRNSLDFKTNVDSKLMHAVY